MLRQASPSSTGLRLRLILLVVIIVIPLIAALLYVADRQRDLATDAARTTVLNLARLAVERQQNLILKSRQLLETIALLPQVRSGERCDEVLAAILRVHPEYSNLGVAGPDGTVFSSALPVRRVVNVSDREDFKMATVARGFAVGTYNLGRITDKPTINFSHAVSDKSGRVIVVVFAALDLEWLSRMVSETNLPRGGISVMFDRSGTVLARYPEPQKWVGRSGAGSPLFAAISTGKKGSEEIIALDGIKRYFAFSSPASSPDIGIYGAVGVPMTALTEPVDRSFRVYVLTLVILGTLALLAVWVGGEIFLLRGLNAFLDRQVTERTRDLEEANRELEAFSYSAAHDLRTPLRGIDGLSRVLQEDYGDRLDDVGRTYLDRLCAAAQHMGKIIDDLYDLAQVRRHELQREDASLSEMVRSIADTLRQRDPLRRVEFVIAPNVVVRGDPHLLRIVLNNLMENAWKFTGNKPDARIEFGVASQDVRGVYFVRDNGAGFDMQYADKLFGAFQRLHSAREFTGTGVGLALVERIIRRHGGKVWGEGVVGGGATFYFTLERGGDDGKKSNPPGGGQHQR